MRNVFVTKISLPNAAPNFRGSETDSRNAGVMLWCHLNIIDKLHDNETATESVFMVPRDLGFQLTLACT